MYESAQLNGDVLAARADHVQTVLNEQMRQRRESGHNQIDWDKLAQAVAHRSSWAMRQAMRLAQKDALEAHLCTEVSSSDLSFEASNQLLLKRMSMPFNSEFPSSLPTCASRRLSLPTSSLYNTTNTRAPVDVFKLKEMNRQFLKSMTAQQQPCAEAHKASGSIPHSNSLALMLVRGRKLAMQNSNNSLPNRNPMSFSNGLQFGHGLRRDSLHGLIRETTKDL